MEAAAEERDKSVAIFPSRAVLNRRIDLTNVAAKLARLILSDRFQFSLIRFDLGGHGTRVISWPCKLIPETLWVIGFGDFDDAGDATPFARIVYVGRVDETLFTADDRLPRTKATALEAEPKLVDPWVTVLLLRQSPLPIVCSQ